LECGGLPTLFKTRGDRIRLELADSLRSGRIEKRWQASALQIPLVDLKMIDRRPAPG
jgi:hypothetical protein